VHANELGRSALTVVGGNVVRLPRYLWLIFGAGFIGVMAIALFAVRSQLSLKSTIAAIAVATWGLGYFMINRLLAKMKHAMSSSDYKMIDAFKREFIWLSSAVGALLLISGVVAISIAIVVTRLREELLIAGIGTCVFGACWLGLATRVKHKTGAAKHTQAS
jgi:hypothetical protein